MRDWPDELLAEDEEDDVQHPALETVKRVLALLSRLYNWANDKGLMTAAIRSRKSKSP